MKSANSAQSKAAKTYNAAADYYDDPANTFWERYGRRTVERLRLNPGARVLDVCCGTGASALVAAEVVGETGTVIGIDLAENLLDLARGKANARGLPNVEFRTGDLLELGVPEFSFDAAVCVFGIFFVEDMKAAVHELWRRVRPGGKLAITTWGPRFFEPASTAFWNSVRNVRPDLYKGFNPWDRITDSEALRSIFDVDDIESLEIQAEPGMQELPTPEDWWPMVLGSGYRGTIEQLTAAQRERVRQENFEFLRLNEVNSIEANVVYAMALRKQG
jgi:ubiquinone/menaquinone biosynthesis C-methylase UbiE